MCGRMKSPQDWSEIKIRLQVGEDRLDEYRPSFNVAPSTPVPVVRFTLTDLGSVAAVGD